MLKPWVLGADVALGLAERGNVVSDPSPLVSINGAASGNNVLEMRQGLKNEDLSTTGFTGPVMWIGHFTTNDGTEETWAAADNGGVAALARKVNNVWAPVAFPDTPNPGNLLYMQGVGMNGKFYLAYDSNVNRLHVWDGTSVRRVGLTTSPPPAVPTPSGGTGQTVTRWYRQRYITKDENGAILRRSEPSSAVTITDKLTIHIVRGSLLNEGETHWEVEAADLSAGPWYLMATVPVATLSYDDVNTAVPTSTPSKPLGSYDPPPSVKFLSTDGLSLMMAGAWETSALAGETLPKKNRVWFTPPLGTSDVGDDERINNTLDSHGWHDVTDAGPITAVQGPVYGETYVTKAQTIAKLTPTGNVDAPYALTIITNAVGCVDQRLMTMGEVGGVPAILFADANAVYALTGQGGIACLSEPVGVMMRALTIVSDPGLMVYDPLERSLFLQTSHNPPSILGQYRNFTFDTYKKRWDGFTLGGSSGGWVLGVSRLGVDNILGGAGMQILNGCVSTQNGIRRLYVCGKDSHNQPSISVRGGQAVLDIDQPFTTTVRYRKVFSPGYKATVGCPTVYFQNPQGTGQGVLTLTASYVRDFTEERTQSVELPATDFSSRLDVGVHTFEGISSADVSVLDLVLTMHYSGPAYTSPVTPRVTCVVVPFLQGEALAQ